MAITTVPPANTIDCPAVAAGSASRLLDRHAAGEVLSVTGDEEQGVVDADAQADHAGHLRRPARDLDQVGDQRHRATPSVSPNSAMPMGRPMAINDPNATSRMMAAATRPIISPRSVSPDSNAKNRSPLTSTWSGCTGVRSKVL